MKWALGFYGQFKKPLFAGVQLLLIYSGIRVIFWIYNRPFFLDLTGAEIWLVFYSGIKQDFMSLLLLNFIPFLLLFIGEYFPSARKYQYGFARWLFIVFNAFGLALNVLDIGYFSFNLHRANIDLFYVVSDSVQTLGSLIYQYWFLFVFFGLLIYVLVRMAKRLFAVDSPSPAVTMTTVANQLLVILIITLLVKRPNGSLLLPSSPLTSLAAIRLPLAQNSMYTFAYSLVRNQQKLVQKNYFQNGIPDSLAKSSLMLHGSSEMVKKNVMIFILESFSRGYLMPGDPLKARTPFFDSLIGQSIFFPNAFANGFNSNQGIVSILGGLPAFLDEPFYYSSYANTPLHGLGNILKENGYSTSFFMGAGKDHFGFEKVGRMAGIETFYWRDQFNDDRFYDGNWGIFDEPFMQWSADRISKMRQPFLGVLFNISSHPPFTIPAAHDKDFIFANQSPAQRAISYVDLAFSKFFEKIKNQPWYPQTIFVFCADHYLFPGDKTPQNGLSVSEIPIFIFDPAKPSGSIDSSVISQVDLGPTILHLLHFNGKILGFGKNAFDPASGNHFALNKPGNIYQIISSEYILGFNPSKDQSEYLYQYRLDPQLRKNLIGLKTETETKTKLEQILKANIQLFQEDLIKRSLD